MLVHTNSESELDKARPHLRHTLGLEPPPSNSSASPCTSQVPGHLGARHATISRGGSPHTPPPFRKIPTRAFLQKPTVLPRNRIFSTSSTHWVWSRCSPSWCLWIPEKNSKSSCDHRIQSDDCNTHASSHRRVYPETCFVLRDHLVLLARAHTEQFLGEATNPTNLPLGSERRWKRR